MKRKIVSIEEFEENKKMKMIESEHVTVVEKMHISDMTPAASGNLRRLNFKLTEKTAKSNLIKAANRNYFEIELKQKSTNLRFSAGAYLHTVMPVIENWKSKNMSKETFREGSMNIKVDEYADGLEMNAKHLDTKIVFNVNAEKVVVHCYNSTQNLMVNGKMYQEFINQYLQPLFVKEIEAIKLKIEEYDSAVLISLGPKRPVRATRSVKSVRSIIHQSHFSCKRCDYTSITQAKLKKHKLTEHSKSLNVSQSILSVKHSTRNNSFSDEMLLCDDLTIGTEENSGSFVLPKVLKTEPKKTENKPIEKIAIESVVETSKEALEIKNPESSNVPVSNIEPEQQNEIEVPRKADSPVQTSSATKVIDVEVEPLLSCDQCDYETEISTDLIDHRENNIHDVCIRSKTIVETEGRDKE